MTISVLYIHPIGGFGGASRSLLELIRAFPPGSVEARVITPRGGVPAILEQEGISCIQARGITQFDCTRFGHYRGLRWLIILREIWYLPFTLAAILRARRTWPTPDVIHVNEVTAIVPAILARVLYRRPLVVHVRSVQETERIGLRRRLLLASLRRWAGRVVAIDDTVRQSLPADLPVDVVHNGFARATTPARDEAIVSLLSRLRPGALRVAMVGNLLPMKGLRELIEAARLCTSRGLDVEYLVVGANPRALAGPRKWVLERLGFAKDVRAELQQLIAQYGLAARFHIAGFTPNIQAVYEAIDVICFPSHLDAVGRPVIEAALCGKPSIVAIRNPLPDTLVPGVTGLAVRPGDFEELAGAIRHFVEHREQLRNMGDAARVLAQRNFDIGKNAARILDIYHAAMNPDRR